MTSPSQEDSFTEYFGFVSAQQSKDDATYMQQNGGRESC